MLDLVIAAALLVTSYTLTLRLAPVIRLPHSWLLSAWVAQVVAAFAYWALVMIYYDGAGDLAGYLRNGKLYADRMAGTDVEGAISVLQHLARSHASMSATGSLLAVSALIQYLVTESPLTISLIFGHIGFAGRLLLFAGLSRHVSEERTKPTAIACLFIPSTLLWTSGLVKETLAVFGLGLTVAGGSQLSQGSRLLGAMGVCVGAYTVSLFKAYLLVPVGLGVAAAACVAAIHARTARRSRLSGSLFLLLAVAMAFAPFAIGALFPRYSPDGILEYAERIRAVGYRVRGGSTFYYDQDAQAQAPAERTTVRPGFVAMAVVTVLFRPLPFESTSLVVLLSSLEMTFLLLLAIRSLARHPLETLWFMSRDVVWVFCLTVAVVGAIGIGLTTVNMGTLSRYRAPIMPFWVCALLYLRGAASSPGDEE